MARKNLLDKVTRDPAAGTKSAAEALLTKAPRGAIASVSKSFEDLKRRALMELDPDLIDAGGLLDRLTPEDGIEELAASIRAHGQQVPVLVRPHPETEGRYQIVYGRRRVAAIKLLNTEEGATPIKVHALLRDLDLEALIVAQGQENSTRRDLSYIERAYFAGQMREAGLDRKIIGEALSVDRSNVSRLLKVIDTVPLDLIEAIGSAPTIGRPRWEKLAEALGRKNMVPFAIGDTSDARFDAVWKELTKKAPRPALRPRTVETSDGRALGVIKRGEDKTILTLDTKSAAGFDDWLLDNLTRLHDQWQSGHDIET